MSFFSEILFIVVLIYLSVMDIRKRVVSMKVLYFLVLIAVINSIFIKKMDMTSISQGAFSGLFIILCSRITRKIGMGDGLVILATGILVGLYDNLLLLLISFLGACISFLVLYVFHKNIHIELPFIPYLTISYCIINLSWLWRVI